MRTVYHEVVFPYRRPNYFAPHSQPDYALGKWLKAVATGGVSLIVDANKEKKAAEAAAKAAQEAAKKEAEKAAMRQKAIDDQKKNLEAQKNIIKEWEDLSAKTTAQLTSGSGSGSISGATSATSKSSMVPVLIVGALLLAGLVFILKKKKR